MLKEINLNRVFIIDIETVPQYQDFDDLPTEMQHLWEQKTRMARAPDQTASSFYERAGIWAEFGKVVCISVGFFYNHQGRHSFKVRSYFGDCESEILLGFNQLLNEQATGLTLCAHNGKEFDFPFLCRRMLINGIQIPNILHIAGKRPWEINHLDTMELWKFGDYKNYTSLDLLATVLNIPTPKDDIDGSCVRGIYYEQKDLQRIVDYCQKDVITTAQILLRFKGVAAITAENITLATSC